MVWTGAEAGSHQGRERERHIKWVGEGWSDNGGCGDILGSGTCSEPDCLKTAFRRTVTVSVGGAARREESVLTGSVATEEGAEVRGSIGQAPMGYLGEQSSKPRRGNTGVGSRAASSGAMVSVVEAWRAVMDTTFGFWAGSTTAGARAPAGDWLARGH